MACQGVGTTDAATWAAVRPMPPEKPTREPIFRRRRVGENRGGGSGNILVAGECERGIHRMLGQGDAGAGRAQNVGGALDRYGAVSDFGRQAAARQVFHHDVGRVAERAGA